MSGCHFKWHCVILCNACVVRWANLGHLHWVHRHYSGDARSLITCAGPHAYLMGDMYWGQFSYCFSWVGHSLYLRVLVLEWLHSSLHSCRVLAGPGVLSPLSKQFSGHCMHVTHNGHTVRENLKCPASFPLFQVMEEGYSYL